MARNVEIKARVSDVGAIRAAASSIAPAPAQVIEQTDTFFSVARGRLKVRGFADGAGELIAYERPDRHGPKESIYTRVPCGDAAALVEILSRLFPVRGVVVKRRELFLAGRTRIHLDRVEGLGDFLELEVVLSDDEPVERGRIEAETLLQALAVHDSALVKDAYIDLLEAKAQAAF